MSFDVISLIFLFVLEKSAEIVFESLLEKFWEWALSDDNLKHLMTSFKLKILVLYLDYLLQTTPSHQLSAQENSRQ